MLNEEFYGTVKLYNFFYVQKKKIESRRSHHALLNKRDSPGFIDHDIEPLTDDKSHKVGRVHSALENNSLSICLHGNNKLQVFTILMLNNDFIIFLICVSRYRLLIGFIIMITQITHSCP